MMISNKAYDILKWVALIALNAVGLCYSKLAAIWDWPFGDQVLGTCAALAFCLGTLLGISSVQYNRTIAKDNEKEAQTLREELDLLANFENFNGEEEET
jgi:hypothetical protein